MTTSRRTRARDFENLSNNNRANNRARYKARYSILIEVSKFPNENV
jgi:hypothetical protein